ncbi:hypothetical protein SEUCBS140593_003544 [Sporothrix eucalyptigena]|uniref:FAD linked oxidase N-terminal domain-containing protein n=1 Tax=Sporothrix eucalyptigena TaxID=1812306 RepID=A0ABP0BG17_9PEZI
MAYQRLPAGQDKFKEISQDAAACRRQVGTMSAGVLWNQVYHHLEPYGLVVVGVGGRSGVVGIPGFVLGGGIRLSATSTAGRRPKWCRLTRCFDAVLASGHVVSATPTNKHRDLYWALRSGDNSFALVTAFHLQASPSGELAVGHLFYPPSTPPPAATAAPITNVSSTYACYERSHAGPATGRTKDKKRDFTGTLYKAEKY